MTKSIEQLRLEMGADYPYDRPDDYPDGARFPAIDWAHAAARGVICDLCDRRGIKHEFGGIDQEIRKELTLSMAAIIREAHRQHEAVLTNADFLRGLE